jgi:hypothetical protein
VAAKHGSVQSYVLVRQSVAVVLGIAVLWSPAARCEAAQNDSPPAKASIYAKWQNRWNSLFRLGRLLAPRSWQQLNALRVVSDAQVDGPDGFGFRVFRRMSAGVNVDGPNGTVR